MRKKILEKLLDDAYRNNIPLTCLFEVTRHCNFSCRHCYAVEKRGRKELNTSQIRDIFTQLKKAGTLFITITGGEPLTRNDFLSIVRRAVATGFYVTIFTNSSLLDARTVKILGSLNIYYVGISLYGARASTHDSFTGVKGSFKKLTSAVKMLTKRGISVVLKAILTGENAGEYREMKKLARRLGAVCQTDPTITPRDNMDKSPLKLRAGEKALADIFADWKQTLTYVKRGSANDDFFNCSAGRSFCTVNAYGDVLACVQIPEPAGNLLEREFADIWRNSAVLKKIRSVLPSELSDCVKCDLAGYCARCPGLALTDDGSLYGRSSEACRQSRIVRKIFAQNH